MTGAVSGSELGAYEPVSDHLLLAALDRAQRHHLHGYDAGVQGSALAEHLGFAYTPTAARRLRRQLARLHALGFLQNRKRDGYTVWRLTADGAKQLARARRKRENLKLPESPQHRRWRSARETAAERVDGFRDELRQTLAEANTLIATDRSVESDVWFNLGRNLVSQMQRLGSITYCLREWPEPGERHPDIDKPTVPGSEHRRSIMTHALSREP